VFSSADSGTENFLQGHTSYTVYSVPQRTTYFFPPFQVTVLCNKETAVMNMSISFTTNTRGEISKGRRQHWFAKKQLWQCRVNLLGIRRDV